MTVHLLMVAGLSAEIYADKPARVSRFMDTLQTCGTADKGLKCYYHAGSEQTSTWAIELVRVGIRNYRNMFIDLVWSYEV